MEKAVIVLVILSEVEHLVAFGGCARFTVLDVLYAGCDREIRRHLVLREKLGMPISGTYEPDKWTLQCEIPQFEIVVEREPGDTDEDMLDAAIQHISALSHAENRHGIFVEHDD